MNKCVSYKPGAAPGVFRRVADSSDEGAKICFSGYCNESWNCEGDLEDWGE